MPPRRYKEKQGRKAPAFAVGEEKKEAGGLPFLLGVAEHEGVADLEVLRLVDVRFLIDVLAVGLDGAQGASRLLRVLARRHAGGKGAADIALRVGKLGVAAEKQLVHQGIHFLFAEVRQTADLRLRGVQIVPRRRHLTAQALLLRLQRGDRPFVGAQLVGEGEQLLENGLLLGVVRRGDAVNARQNGAEVAVGVKDAAGDAYREEEHQQEKKLHGAASHGGHAGAGAPPACGARRPRRRG